MNGVKTDIKSTITTLLSAILRRAGLSFLTCSLFPGQSGHRDSVLKSTVKMLAACSVPPMGPHHLFILCAICSPLVLVLIRLPISCVLLLFFRRCVLTLSYRCVSSCLGWLPPLEGPVR